MKLFAVALLGVLCSGCAGERIWVNPSKSSEEAQKDFRECSYDSDKHSFVPYGDGRSPVSAGLQQGFQSVNLMNGCMQSRGYSLVDKDLNSGRQNFRTQSINAMSEAINNNDYNKALTLANLHLERYPYSADALTVRALSNSSFGKYDLAIADFENALKLINTRKNDSDAKTKFIALSGKAMCLAELGEYDIALELINICIDSNRMDSYLYNNRAYTLNKKGDYDKAIEDCNKSIALDSLSAPPYKNRGLAYYGKGQYDKAIESFNKSLAIDSLYAKAYLSRGDAYLKVGKAESATADFKKACELLNKDACLKIGKDVPTATIGVVADTKKEPHLSDK